MTKNCKSKILFIQLYKHLYSYRQKHFTFIIDMDFYQSLGYLVLGSRMRRISEYFLAEVNKVYQDQQIAFEASWFPLFYILSEEKELSIREISNRIQVSHSAVSQLITNLRKKGLVASREAEEDGRVQLVKLTMHGVDLLEKIKPIWNSLQNSMEEIVNEGQNTISILDNLATIEKKFSEENLSQRMLSNLENCTVPEFSIDKQMENYNEKYI